MIRCGWCDAATEPGRCSQCGRDPALPWTQRATEPPKVNATELHRKQLAEAETALRKEGHEPTAERLAEYLGISDRNVRRWQADVRSAS